MLQLVSAVVLWPLGRDYTERVLIIKAVRSSDTDHQHHGYKGAEGGMELLVLDQKSISDGQVALAEEAEEEADAGEWKWNSRWDLQMWRSCNQLAGEEVGGSDCFVRNLNMKCCRSSAIITSRLCLLSQKARCSHDMRTVAHWLQTKYCLMSGDVCVRHHCSHSWGEVSVALKPELSRTIYQLKLQNLSSEFDKDLNCSPRCALNRPGMTIQSYNICLMYFHILLPFTHFYLIISIRRPVVVSLSSGVNLQMKILSVSILVPGREGKGKEKNCVRALVK